MNNKYFISIFLLVVVTSIMSISSLSANNIKVEVQILGKGGGTGSTSGTITICPEESSKACAVIKVELYEQDIKEGFVSDRYAELYLIKEDKLLQVEIIKAEISKFNWEERSCVFSNVDVYLLEE